MNSFTTLPKDSSATPPAQPTFTPEEIDVIRKGKDGIMGILPARCYYDQEIYRWEVENVLKKNWLYVGAWDWAEKPGDYFTLTMFGEPLVITRDKEGKLHCLVNSCRHRWAQVVPEGRGHKNVFICPYHRWSYNIDGSLRGVSKMDIPNLPKKDCALPQIRVEEWNGLIFINFDQDAEPLGPQLEPINEILKPYNLGKFRSAGITTYDSTWNYKFSFETGYEAYHHCGVHGERIGDWMPPEAHRPLMFGKNWGAYAYRGTPAFVDSPYRHPFGNPPWMTEEQAANVDHDAIFLGIYPNFISFIQPHQISTITTQHVSATQNVSSTTIAIADWAHERPGAEEGIAAEVQFMKDVQDEDTLACQSLDAGVRSKFNQRGYVHPVFEEQMSHYFNWFLDQYGA